LPSSSTTARRLRIGGRRWRSTAYFLVDRCGR
jgi:hypothetical protein